MTAPIWSPTPERIARANLTRFLAHVRTRAPAGAEDVWDVPSLYAWSVARPEAFWPEVWRFCGVVAEERPGHEPWDQVVTGLDRKPYANPAGVTNVIRLMKRSNPKVENVKPETLIDDRILKKIDQSGFIDKVFQ